MSLDDATLSSLRHRIVVVPQEGFLFAGTIRDNVRVGQPDASDADVDAALEALGIRDRFLALPEGLDTEVRERGSRLSAGERQLVSLARAALADPALLVLDEATSNLDPGTERDVERTLEALTAGRRVVVVAHRLSTAARADRIARRRPRPPPGAGQPRGAAPPRRPLRQPLGLVDRRAGREPPEPVRPWVGDATLRLASIRVRSRSEVR